MTARAIQIRAERREIGGVQVSVLMARGRDVTDSNKWGMEPAIIAHHVPEFRREFSLTVLEEVKKDIHDWWRNASGPTEDFIGPDTEMSLWLASRTQQFRKRGTLE